jgi:hypothetical protein
MREHSFDQFTRRAATAVSRRATLATLGAAGAAALIHPLVADAKTKNKKKSKKKSGQNGIEQCQQQLAQCTAQGADCTAQVADCTTFVTAICGSDPSCQDVVGCCALLESCQAAAFLTCLNTRARS